jgi:hypothetical protein
MPGLACACLANDFSLLFRDRESRMKTLLFAGAAVAALASGPAFAQPPQGGPGGGMRMPQNRAEVQQMIQQRFSEADANHDGFVTREEMGAGPGGSGAGRGGNRFDRIDANHDGKLSLDELSNPMLARFDRVDANHDGTISPEERETARAAMRARMQERSMGGEAPPMPGGDEPPQG